MGNYRGLTGLKIKIMEFVTLGMLILDEVFYPIPRVPALNILGGAGAYAALGARIISGAERAAKVGWTIHEGSDFPELVKRQIGTWKTSCEWIKTPNRLTTRGLNVYKQNEFRGKIALFHKVFVPNNLDFEFASPKIRIDESTLTPEQLQSRSFHLVCSPQRCIDLVKGISARGKGLCGDNSWTDEKPTFVWEPVPGK